MPTYGTQEPAVKPTKFWAVWRMTGGSTPSVRHATKEEALLEANRLASSTNTTYYVLEAVGIVQPPKPPVEYTEL